MRRPNQTSLIPSRGQLKESVGIIRVQIAFSPDGRELAVGYTDGVIRIYDAVSGVFQREIVGHQGAIAAMSYSPQGRWLASGALHPDFTVRVSNPATGEKSGDTGWPRQLTKRPGLFDRRRIPVRGQW